MIVEPLAHTLARIGGGLFGATILLFLLVVWMADMRGATDHQPQLKKWRGRWRVALFTGFGVACIVIALIPTPIPTTAYRLAREQMVALFFPAYALFFIAYVVWFAIELRKTLAWRQALAWRQQQRRQSLRIRRRLASNTRGSGTEPIQPTTASVQHGPFPRLSRRMRRLSRSR